jgi:hypothetical protein
MAMLARWECGITEKDPEARVDCAMAHALQFTIETGGSVHGTVCAIAMVRSRQTDMPVGEVDAQHVDSVASVVSVIHLPGSVCLMRAPLGGRVHTGGNASYGYSCRARTSKSWSFMP